MPSVTWVNTLLRVRACNKWRSLCRIAHVSPCRGCKFYSSSTYDTKQLLISYQLAIKTPRAGSRQRMKKRRCSRGKCSISTPTSSWVIIVYRNSINIPHMLLYFFTSYPLWILDGLHIRLPFTRKSHEIAAQLHLHFAAKCVERFNWLKFFMNETLLITNSFVFPFTDIKLRFCDVPSTGSCCNAAIETKMALYTRNAMEKNTRDLISKMSSTLQTRAQKYNGEFIDKGVKRSWWGLRGIVW